MFSHPVNRILCGYTAVGIKLIALWICIHVFSWLQIPWATDEDIQPPHPPHSISTFTLLSIRMISCGSPYLLFPSEMNPAQHLFLFMSTLSSTSAQAVLSFQQAPLVYILDLLSICKGMATNGVWLYWSWNSEMRFQGSKREHITFTWQQQQVGGCGPVRRRGRKAGVRHKGGDKFRPAVTAKWEKPKQYKMTFPPPCL